MRAVIWSNGRFGPAEFYLETIKADDYLICADGGANYALALELIPDLVVGDMDSIDTNVRAELAARGLTEFVVVSDEKDESDSELALKAALARRPDEIIMTGVLGDRIDHSLANIGLLSAVPEDVPASIVEPGATLVLVRKTLTLRGRPGQIVSVLPFGGDASGVTLTGLKYPLSDAPLSQARTLGLSNVIVESTVSISVDDGMLLVTILS